MNSEVMEPAAFAVLAGTFVLMIRWMLNQMTSKLREVGESIRICAMVQLDMHKTLIIHDAQIRGVHPAAGVDPTDASLRAHEEYEKVLRAIDATSEVIKQTFNRHRHQPE